jgi:hypothetical protein
MFTLSIRLLLLCTLICSVPTFVNAQSNPSLEEDKLLAVSYTHLTLPTT